MADSVVARIPKPQLRRLLANNFKRHAVFAAIFCTVNVIWFKFLVVDPRKKKYAEYYKNYNLEAEFESMKKAGVFQSCK